MNVTNGQMDGRTTYDSNTAQYTRNRRKSGICLLHWVTECHCASRCCAIKMSNTEFDGQIDQ